MKPTETQKIPYVCPPTELLSDETKSGVSLRAMLESEEMRQEKSPLVLALGRNDAGALVTLDLAAKGHLLIAGSTDVQKRMCLYSVVQSILFRASPQDVKLVLIDSMGSVFSAYRGIAHLLVPVIDYGDTYETRNVLQWVKEEMNCRYESFINKHVLNIEEYNAALGENEEPMSRIVIVMAELSDLGLAGVETAKETIAYLAMKARAAGIHLVLATMRPRECLRIPDAMANMNRIALMVNSEAEGGHILGETSAEKLNGGCGDMLVRIMSKDLFELEPLKHVKGYFASDDAADGAAKSVGDWLREHYVPDYSKEEVARIDELFKQMWRS